MNIQDRQKVFRLQVLKNAQTMHTLPCLSRDRFQVVSLKNHEEISGARQKHLCWTTVFREITVKRPIKPEQAKKQQEPFAVNGIPLQNYEELLKSCGSSA